MPKDGSKTKDRILDETTQLVLANGFVGTTIDQILERTQLTKGAFFYHFKNKDELALELMHHFVKSDLSVMEQALKAVEPYSHAPRERLLRFVQWFVDQFSRLEAPHAGCLYASYIYEPEQLSQEIKGLVEEVILKWREALVILLSEAAGDSTVSIAFDIDSLADHFSVILEGAFILSKALNDPALTAKQLMHYRNYLELIFGEKEKELNRRH